ncbi:DUF2877 domain-containing protein [Qingrenia yutianensis]|uniref:DUF2877 domain-containing protein n=1 Tax=Qingrenia yutianensis TaxID=2763676 RepID=A0A926FCG0_9FIRM|nr:DUF2877 domain-containing protein [Qingrenia yutianensis]MBC8595909.1 DUF2877 domain-containing protein [Qingrenia yutianensis]
MNLKVTHICENVNKINWHIGRTAGIYKNCFNVITEENELVTFFKKTDRFSTRAVLTDFCSNMTFLQLSDGMRVTRFEKCILAGNVVFDMACPEIISVKRGKIQHGADIQKNIGILKKTLEIYGRKSPVFEDKILSEKVKYGFELLKENPLSGFSALIGLGAGLTPSCDDIISGISAYFYLNGIGERFNGILAKYLYENGDFSTAAVSKNLLTDVANGYINSSLYNLICAVANDEKSIEKCALDMIDYGSTSGTETCYGVILGYILSSKKELKEWL